MSASQAVSLTCSVAPGRRRVRGWGRRGAARARATCGACYVRGVRGCVWPSLRHAFWIFQRTRARRVFPICYLTRALIRLRPRTVTARDGTMPRTCGRKLTRWPDEPSVPVRVRACNSIYTSPRIPPRRLLSKRARLTSHKRALGHTHAVRHHWQSGPRERSRGEAASHPS